MNPVQTQTECTKCGSETESRKVEVGNFHPDLGETHFEWVLECVNCEHSIFVL